MNCHSQIWVGSDRLDPVRASYRTNKSLKWHRVYNLPGFVYFDHSIHVQKGIGCNSATGASTMPFTYQVPSLLMEWCLNCHRKPEKEIRPREQVFNMRYKGAGRPGGPRRKADEGLPRQRRDPVDKLHGLSSLSPPYRSGENHQRQSLGCNGGEAKAGSPGPRSRAAQSGKRRGRGRALRPLPLGCVGAEQRMGHLPIPGGARPRGRRPRDERSAPRPRERKSASGSGLAGRPRVACSVGNVCRATNICRLKAQPTILGHRGGFATHVRCHWAWAIPLPKGVNYAEAGPLLCGGVTVFNPLVLHAKPTSHVGVVGIGGLGHMAVKFADA